MKASIPMPEELPEHNILRTTLAFIGGALIIAGGAFLLWGVLSQSLSRVASNSSSIPSLLPANPFDGTLKGEEDGRVNILILGISGTGYISGELTDSIIVASLAPQQGDAHLIGLPRDLWVRTPDASFTKINELYGLAGGTDIPDAGKTDLMRAKAEEITGLPIHYAVVADLDATSAVVEIIGGLTLEGTFYDAQSVTMYVRDRSTAGGDFDRMRRQQHVIVGIMESLRESDPATLIELYGVLSEHISTSANLTELLRFFEVGRSLNADTVTFNVITPQTNGLLKSQYRDVAGRNIYTIEPTAGLTDYSAIHAYILTILE
ncbi:MAG: LCP family protein [Candidatus Spechtbacterales bacterium]